MRTSRDDHNTPAANPFAAVARLQKLVWALENAKPVLRQVLLAGRRHPAFNTLQSELGNLDYVTQTLPIERDEDGRPQRPDRCREGA